MEETNNSRKIFNMMFQKTKAFGSWQNYYFMQQNINKKTIFYIWMNILLLFFLS